LIESFIAHEFIREDIFEPIYYSGIKLNSRIESFDYTIPNIQIFSISLLLAISLSLVIF